MASSKIVILILSVFFIVNCQECVSPYWELQNSVIRNNQLNSVSSVSIPINNAYTQNTHLTVKSYWNLTDFKENGFGDSSDSTIEIRNNTSIYVNNYRIKLNITFHALRTSGKNLTYNGIGSASLNVIVNYVKQITPQDKYLSLKLLSLDSVFESPSITYNPVPIDENKIAFDNLFKSNIVNQIKAVYNQTLFTSAKQQVEKQQVALTFGQYYQYKFGNFTTKYLMNANSFNIYSQSNNFSILDGLAIGYYASTQNKKTCATSQKPYSQNYTSKVSFFSVEFCQDLLANSLKNNPDWSQILVDSAYSTDIFQFEMQNLETVIPQAIKTYPGPLVKVYLRCNSTTTGNKVTIDSTYFRIQSSIDWQCNLLRAGGYGLAGFSANIGYNTYISQSKDRLSNTISSLSLNNIKYFPLLFSVADQTLATSYVKSVLDKFSKKATLGSDFLQPLKQSYNVTYDNRFVAVYESLQSLNELIM